VVQIVSDALDAFNRADRERLDGMVHPDFEVVSPLADVRGRPYRGAEGAREWGDEVTENFASIVTSTSSLEEIGPGRVLATGTAKVRGRASGLEYDRPLGLVVDVVDERVVKLQVCFDLDQARALAKED
jgi:ketosteroid isomerase-like protein